MGSPGVEANKALFLEKVRQSNSACQVGLYYIMVGFYYIIMPGGGLPDGPVPVQRGHRHGQEQPHPLLQQVSHISHSQ